MHRKVHISSRKYIGLTEEEQKVEKIVLTPLRDMVWEADFHTKTIVLRAVEFYRKKVAECKLRSVPWAKVFNALIAPLLARQGPKGGQSKAVSRGGSVELTKQKTASLTKTVRAWWDARSAIKLNFVVAPKAKRCGGGTKGSIPIEVQLTQYKHSVSDFLKGETVNFERILWELALLLRSRGYNVFRDSKEKKLYEAEQKQYFDARHEELDIANGYFQDEDDDVYEELPEDEKDRIYFNKNPILLTDVKVYDFMKKWNLQSVNSNKCTFFHPGTVMSLQFESLCRAFVTRLLLPIKNITTRDQTMMFSFMKSSNFVVPKKHAGKAGWVKKQSELKSFTLSPSINFSLENGRVCMGNYLLIMPSGCQDPSEPSTQFRRALARFDLEPGNNPEVGMAGLTIVTSGNGWQQKYHMDVDVCSIANAWPDADDADDADDSYADRNKAEMEDNEPCARAQFANSLLPIDGWEYYAHPQFIDRLLEHKIVPIAQAAGMSGATGILDLSYQSTATKGLKALQRKYSVKGPRAERFTASGNPKAPGFSVQCDFIKQMMDEQAADFARIGKKEWFYQAGYGLNPARADDNDEHYLSNLKLRESNGKLAELHGFRGLRVNPLGMSFYDLVANRTKLRKPGPKANDTGKSTLVYSQEEAKNIGKFIMADSDLYARDDRADFLRQVREFAKFIAEQCKKALRLPDMADRDDVNTFKRVYDFVVRQFDFEREFYDYFIRDNVDGEFYEIESEDDDADDDEKDDVDKRKKRQKKKMTAERTNLLKRRYSVAMEATEEAQQDFLDEHVSLEPQPKRPRLSPKRPVLKRSGSF